MTTEIQNIQPITPEEADRIAEWWPHLLRSPLESREERDEVAVNVKRLSEPADMTWLMARIAALLTPYYSSEVPHGVRMIEAEDWAEALAGYPAWAVTKACRWWKSEHNDRRNIRPKEGDIAERCRFETQALRLAERAVGKFDEGRGQPVLGLVGEPMPFREVTPEMKARAEEIVRNAGFGFRRAAE